jgi:hypothetical protein
MLADEYELDVTDGTRTFRLLKFASGPEDTSTPAGAPG